MISTVRFPTEKAYGVTINQTIRALRAYGHTVDILTPESIKNDLSNLLARLHIKQRVNEICFKIIFKIFLLNRTMFLIYRMFFAFIARKKITSTPQVTWIRDPIVSLFMKNRDKTTIVLEVHQKMSDLDYFVTRHVLKNTNMILAPISKALKEELELQFTKTTNLQIIDCPMGVPDEFLSYPQQKNLKKSTEFRIGYVGGFYSNGVDQDILQTIRCIQKVSSNRFPKITHLRLIGIEPKIIENIEDILQKSSKLVIETYPRVNQTDLLLLLDDVDIFILPYPEGEFFRNRFPLKALEYAALRRPILVTRTLSHKNIFNDDEVWFYEPGNCSSFAKTVFDLLHNAKSQNQKINKAYKKAQLHSYTKRIERIIEAL